MKWLRQQLLPAELNTVNRRTMWMFYRAFEDLDHHQWEVMYGDESQFPEKK